MFILRHTNQDKDFKKSLTWREFEWCLLYLRLGLTPFTLPDNTSDNNLSYLLGVLLLIEKIDHGLPMKARSPNVERLASS